MAAPKLKIPGESTTKPSFASPQVQTGADVGMSQKVAGIAPPQTPAATPNDSQTPVQFPGQGGPATGPTTDHILKGGVGPVAFPNAPAPTPPANPPIQGQPEPSNPNAPAISPPQTPITGPTATVPTNTGAPPGVPLTTPPTPVSTPALIPPKALEGRNAAENDYIQAQNETNRRNYEAAMKYSGGPDSELEANRTAAAENRRGATNARGGQGTIESSLYQGDLGRIGTRLATANLKSYDTYQKSIGEAQDALQKALVIWQRAGETERREIAEAKEKREATEAYIKSLDHPNPLPVAAAGPPYNPGGTVDYVGTPGAGGVTPYEEHTPSGGFVRVGGRKK